jgi:acetyl-CoA carboxylase carboxyl transferase subunit beta
MDFEYMELNKQDRPKWWQRLKKNINTETNEKLDTPDGIWFKCPKCNHTEVAKDFEENFWICNKCEYHARITSRQYFSFIFDQQDYQLHFENIRPTDKLEFVDESPYPSKIERATKKTGLTEAISVAKGKIEGMDLVIACMDFTFIGGSMGSVVGERIAKGIDLAIQTNSAFMIISKSGGARMMESAFSLMQMAKTSAKLTQLSKAKLPYISLMTDPTTGGVSASYAMLGDINIAEPKALIGFAGPRVVKETIKKELPKDFQSAESLLENGFLDFIVHRKELRSRLAAALRFFMNP